MRVLTSHDPRRKGCGPGGRGFESRRSPLGQAGCAGSGSLDGGRVSVTPTNRTLSLRRPGRAAVSVPVGLSRAAGQLLGGPPGLGVVVRTARPVGQPRPRAGAAVGHRAAAAGVSSLRLGDPPVAAVAAGAPVARRLAGARLATHFVAVAKATLWPARQAWIEGVSRFGRSGIRAGAGPRQRQAAAEWTSSTAAVGQDSGGAYRT